MLPHDFPPKSTVYEHYRAWQEDGTWQAIHDSLRTKVRERAGKAATATAGMLDSQSVKTGTVSGERGYDAAKKTNGRKRHLLVDTLGLIIAIVITMGSVQDRDSAKLVFADATDQSTLQKVWADGGYRGKRIAWTQEHYNWDLEIVERRKGEKGFVLLAKRWVVERTFGWLNGYRLLSKEYETTLESSLADVQIAMCSLMSRRLTRTKTVPENENRFENEAKLMQLC